MDESHHQKDTDLVRTLLVLCALRIGKLCVELLTKPTELGERGLENLLRSAEERRQIFHGTPRPGDLVLFGNLENRRSPLVAKQIQGSATLLSSKKSLPMVHSSWLVVFGADQRDWINIQQASALKTSNGVFINDIKVDEEFPGGELFYAFMDPGVKTGIKTSNAETRREVFRKHLIGVQGFGAL